MLEENADGSEGRTAAETDTRKRTRPLTKLGSTIASLGVWVLWQALVILWTPIVLAVFLLTSWCDRGRRVTGRVFRWGSRALLLLNPFWKLAVQGHVPSREAHPLVVVSNHESLADILIIGTLPWEMKWLSKQSNFRVPFIGQMMWMAGDVGVRRGDPASRAKAYERLGEWIDRGVSVMVFPEGTRSRTHRMLPFRNGAFRLAIETGRPVLPLAVSGTREAIRKGAMRFGRADVVLRILEPIPVEGLGESDVVDLRNRVREAIDRARARALAWQVAEEP